MAVRNSRASILVNAAILAVALVHLSAQVRARDGEGTIAPLEALWAHPSDIATRDLFLGSGGAELAPPADATFAWVSTDTTGYSPGFEVRDSAGRTWNVKLGPEAQTEVAASRVLWAIGYHQPPTYYVESWDCRAGPADARARRDSESISTAPLWPATGVGKRTRLCRLSPIAV